MKGIIAEDEENIITEDIEPAENIEEEYEEKWKESKATS